MNRTIKKRVIAAALAGMMLVSSTSCQSSESSSGAADEGVTTERTKKTERRDGQGSQDIGFPFFGFGSEETTRAARPEAEDTTTTARTTEHTTERTVSEQTTEAVTTTYAPETYDYNYEYEYTIDTDAYEPEINEADEEGAGRNYITGEKAGNIDVLCYYDFSNISPENEIMNIFAYRFGGSVSTRVCSYGEYNERLGTYIVAGDSPDIVRYETDMLPGLMVMNRFTALDDWLDLDSPVWSDVRDITEKYSYNGRHYYYPTNLSPQYGIVYSTANTEMIGVPDPMDLYFQGEWTWDAFADMLARWEQAGSGNIGISTGDGTALHFAATAGVPAIGLNGNVITNNLRSVDIKRAMSFGEKLASEGYIYSGWYGPENGFKDGNLFCYIMPVEWALEECQTVAFKNNLPGEVRAVPIPRDPNADKYSILGGTYGYLVPAGAGNMQGATAWILSARIYQSDPEVVRERRDRLMYDGPYYYEKCTECKYQFESPYGEPGDTCPDCGTPRKTKFKVTYSERQMKVIDDMADPSKFDFVFDFSKGFGQNVSDMTKQIMDEPFKGSASFSSMLESYYSAVEAELDTYRSIMQ